MTIADEQLVVPAAQVDNDGYFLVEDLVSASECSRLSERLQHYAQGGIAPAGGVTIQREPALQGTSESRGDGTDVRKVGALFHDDLFRALISSDRVVGRMRQLVGAQVRLFRADALMKPAGIGSAKGVHQDSPYWPIQPMSLWSCWIPFDDATLDNGCLNVVPGSHRDGPLTHVRESNDFVVPTGLYDMEAMTPVPMRRGTGLFFHSLLLHGSGENVSGNPRRAATMSYMGGGHSYTGESAEPDYPVVG